MFSKKSRGGSRVPQICPKCRCVYRNGGDDLLCPECGETMITQGYCPVCERYLPLNGRWLCPKHEIELEAFDPASVTRRIGACSVSWVTVGVYPDSQSTAAPRIRLEAEGIPTFVDGERMGSPGMYRQAIGGAKLQVPAEREVEARIILSQTWSLPPTKKPISKTFFEDGCRLNAGPAANPVISLAVDMRSRGNENSAVLVLGRCSQGSRRR